MNELQDNKDRRLHSRVELKQKIATASEKQLLLGEVYDISPEGISFLSDVEYSPGAKIYVLFPGIGGIRENEVEAEVIRSKLKSGSSDRYKIAAMFLNTDPCYLEDITTLINQ